MQDISELPAVATRAETRPDRGRRKVRLHRDFGEPSNSPTPRAIPLEIAFLADYEISPEILGEAVAAADLCGVDADAALLGEGLVSDEVFYRALADRLGAPYYTGGLAIESPVEPQAAISSGFVKLKPNDMGLRAVVAPQGAALRFLLEAAAAGRPRPPIAICARQRLTALIRAGCGGEVARKAAYELDDSDHSLTASRGLSLAQIAIAGFLALIAVAAWLSAPGLLRSMLSVVLWLVFTGAILLRSAAVAAAGAAPIGEPLSDEELPVYTVIAALYRESGVVRDLVTAFDAFDYPRAKLDIKLVVERRDKQTLASIAALRLPPRYDVIVAPPGAPSTKPRALNVALGAARGDLVVVFDAEDRPAPDQLRLAAARFAADRQVDCLQARLTIHNAADSWLSALFAIEYSALFDLVNPGLAALGLPIALGGSSNHFRIHTLRRVGGWDAWNVTEDADLGMRLARFDATVGALASDTSEEAPNDFANWFQQRVRWQKGWVQTLIVHSRHPIRFGRELGGRRAMAAGLLVAGTVLGGLFGLPLLADALGRAARNAVGAGGRASQAADVVTYLLTLSGAQAIIVPALVAMRLRGMTGAARALALAPAYFLLVCLATWAALFDLGLRPFYWAKTDHGRQRIAVRRGGDLARLEGETAVSRALGRAIAD